MGQFRIRRNISSAVFRNQMEDRVLRNKLGSIELEERRSLRRFGSETRLLKIRQEQRLGSLICDKRNGVNGTHINKAGNSSPTSAGATCPLDFGKLQLRFDKRQSSASIYAYRECPVNASDNNTFLADGEWTQLSRRLPRLSSVDGKKTPEPLSPALKYSCKSPVTLNRKPPIVVQDNIMSADKASPREAHETKGIQRGNHGNGGNSNSFVATKPHKKNNGPRVRRQTWNGKIVPKRPEPKLVTARKRSYSDKDQPQTHRLSSLRDSTENTSDDISRFHTNENVFVTDLNTSWNKKTFPTAEDAARRNFLSVPEHPVSKETLNSRPVSSSSQRRHQRLGRQENVTRNSSSRNVSKCSIEFPRGGESESGAARKHGTGQTVNKHAELTNKEITVLKNISLIREKVAARSMSFSSSLGQSSKEEIQMDIPKRKESIKPRKRGLDKGLETKEEVLLPVDKSNWMKAMRKVNLFLRGMAALRKQRELDRLALKVKQDALEKLYHELEHCRYLRLPSNEDDEKIDFISWVFEKD